MAKRKEKIVRTVVEKGRPKKRWHDDIDPHTKKSIFAVLFFVLTGITLLAYWGRAGVLGVYLFDILDYLIGRAYFLAPITFLLIAFSLIFSFQRKFFAATFIGGAIFLVSSLALIDLLLKNHTAGAVGYFTNLPLFKIFDFWASMVIEAGLLVVGFLITLNIPLFKKSASEEAKDIETRGVVKEAAEGLKDFASQMKNVATEMKEGLAGGKGEGGNVAATSAVTVDAGRKAPKSEEQETEFKQKKIKSNYKKPPLDLLSDDRGTPSSGDIRANANIIRRTLQNFGIDVEMGEVSVGPTVTQYTLKPAEGVKLSRIEALHKDLSLALAAHPIRIEAPIPGKSLVGIEIPNRSIALVGLRSLFENSIYQESEAALLFALGRDVAGAPVYANLAKMPHLLVAGSTGSGKSVSIHSIMISFLYRNSPEMLKFLVIDPKRVELASYSGIPHLLTAPITDYKKAIAALRWAVREMEHRYEILAGVGARDLVGYNNIISGKKSGEEELMPYIVIVIDELADLMVSFPREVEGSIIRLAQMARAVGIHLIVSTQRPSVEVITGLIKANITSRIAFQVASQVDSRTILDMGGAEKLLGNGDMLFLAGDTAKPRRIQGAFVSEGEVKKAVEFLKEQMEEEASSGEEIFANERASEFDSDGIGGDGDDPLYEEARELIIEAGKASASYLQRRLKVGYARAARLLDMLEEQGVIGPGEGAKPREILIGKENQDSI
ncbi:MAG: DNA translocase FtsK [bacterium]|nr:DNA translocase FtsK [bacterium]